MVEAFLTIVAAWGVETTADRGGTSYAHKGSGLRRVENRVGLGVAFLARGTLDPNNIAAGVEHHVIVSWWGPYSDAGEVLAAALCEPGNDRTAEVQTTTSARASLAAASSGGEVGDGFDSDGVALETKFEKGFRGGI